MNCRCTNRGHIWVGWNPTIVDVSVIECHDDIIHCRATDLANNLNCFIYGANVDSDRRGLWRTLLSIVAFLPVHLWALLGDFSVVLSNNEILGGNPTNLASREFTSYILGCYLQDVSYDGFFVTWCNKRDPPICIYKMLDRNLVLLLLTLMSLITPLDFSSCRALCPKVMLKSMKIAIQSINSVTRGIKVASSIARSAFVAAQSAILAEDTTRPSLIFLRLCWPSLMIFSSFRHKSSLSEYFDEEHVHLCSWFGLSPNASKCNLFVCSNDSEVALAIESIMGFISMLLFHCGI
ncbi:hypothetical protein Nepgr_001785 [Nepenthes gracilis]|uniref:Uncharacterized protein n=1 Tax=Nepenthes gracilis TaxID=150966 RepID=A0AAD3RXR5_NEPGR|nr:hypothetical protein Nepgr_001785 [Nepenthes gracilis]